MGRPAREWLDGHVDLELGVGRPAGRRAAAPTLDRMVALCDALGSPERDLAVIHLTGTNGKTSTVRMCVALLAALGLRVGAYTSPHLSAVNERLTLHGEAVTDDVLDELLDAVRLAEPEVEARTGSRLSYFEILTGAALRWFADEAVDAAVVEVGLGGTWDATNVVDARVAVVTNVSIDHVEYLGPTRADIAAEKAGIVTPGCTLVLGETDPELQPFFLEREPGRVLRRDQDFGARRNRVAHGGRVVDLYTPEAGYPEVLVPLHGAHQGENAAAALAACEAFVGSPLPVPVVEQALAGVTSPGRLEVVRRRPLVVLDGAHNVDGAQTAAAALAEEFPALERTLVVGLLREKEPHEMLLALGARDAARLVVCRPPSPRGLDPRDVAAAALDLGVDPERLEVCETVAEAIGHATLETPDDAMILVTGTLYVVGAARGLLV